MILLKVLLIIDKEKVSSRTRYSKIIGRKISIGRIIFEFSEGFVNLLARALATKFLPKELTEQKYPEIKLIITAKIINEFNDDGLILVQNLLNCKIQG